VSAPAPAGKRPAIVLTPASRVRIRSAGPEDQAIVSEGVFRGLVSIGGDNALAVELASSDREENGRVRLVPLSALLAIDILEAAKPEEEKRAEPSQTPGYFR
jgi:hypothetical protein